MFRVFGLLALTAVGAGLYLLFVAPDPEPAGFGVSALPSAPGGYGSYSGWAVGLVMGLALAWLAGLDWANLPERLGAWFRLQRRRLGWAMLGGVLAAVLLLF